MHYIDDSFIRNFIVLSTEPMLDSHAGDQISDSLNHLMQNFNIGREKVQIIMRDAASSMRLALEFAEFESFDCFVHKFQLVILLYKFLSPIFY